LRARIAAWWTRRSIICRGGGVVAEDLAPGGERLVGSDDHRGALVAARDEAEHQVGGLGVKRDIATATVIDADDYESARLDKGWRGF
jgi:hypothetical protein